MSHLYVLRRVYKRSRRFLYWQKHRYVDDFSFVHIPKTGGTSVETALGLPHQHERVRTIRDWLGAEEYQRRFVFSIVRNPWDLNVSLYHFRKQADQFPAGPAPSFPEWVRLVYVAEDPRFRTAPWAGRTQTWWLQNEAGEIIVDCIAKLETISKDWKKICARIGVDVALPHSNKSSRAGYQQYYDDKSRKIIRDQYAVDIENFEYEF